MPGVTKDNPVMSGPLSELFDGLSEGLVLLGREWSVRYANRAARERFGLVTEGRVCDGVRDTLLRWAHRGYVSGASMVSLPVPLPGRAQERMHVNLYEGLLDGELALLVRDAPDVARREAIGHLFLEAMGDELGAALRSGAGSLMLAARVVRSAQRLDAKSVELVARNCEQGADRLQCSASDIARRVQVGREALADFPSPSALGAVLDEAIDWAEAALSRRAVTVSGGAGAERDVTVPGNALVLRWAFSALFRAAAHAVPSGSVLHLSARAEPGRVAVRLVASSPPGSAPASRDSSEPARRLAERLFREAEASLTTVTFARRGAPAFLVTLPNELGAVSGYLRALSQLERDSSELAQLVLRRIAGKASRA